MRKNLNKVIAFAIGVSVISGSVVPAMADTNNAANVNSVNQEAQQSKKVLTLKDAVESAKSINNNLALLDEQIKLNDTVNDLNDKINDIKNEQDDSSTTGLSDDKKDYLEDKNKLTLEQLKQNREYAADKLEENVRQAYNGLILSEADIAKLKEDIELQKTQIEQYNLKKNLGLVTDINIDKINIDLQNNLNNLKSKENNLKDSKYNFKVLTGKDVDNYILEDNIQYDKFKLNGDLDQYLDSQIEDFVSYTEEINKLNKDFWDDDDNKVTNKDIPDKPDVDKIETTKSSLTFADDDTVEQKIDKIQKYLNTSNSYVDQVTLYTGMISSRINYLQSKSSVVQSELQLKEAKDQYKQILRGVYTNLLAAEDSIDLINANIELTNKQIRLNKINYDLGLMTKLEYDQSVNGCEALNIQLKNAVNNYNNLKIQLEKPWLKIG